ncbi:uncharacterized protein B0H18DRAFT_1027023 [Fomitopsis serialis]|uniref:uncharacterized protein n=1 Tax=Fomitopsis serialis TaxID=139415 RepID=UPI002008477F|nr:uncharacterized protein B0H18DRAFT_1027023 [Neoantrodia serialis]KAH9919593.1 hypothetical protein B0H18DRAFT_1027023 [Neoantrodia serialis]
MVLVGRHPHARRIQPSVQRSTSTFRCPSLSGVHIGSAYWGDVQFLLSVGNLSGYERISYPHKMQLVTGTEAYNTINR